MKKIRNNRNQFEKSKSIKLDENLNVKREDDYPIFCFKYLHKDYSLEQCENHIFASCITIPKFNQNKAITCNHNNPRLDKNYLLVCMF